MTTTLMHADALETLRGMEDNSVDSIVTDPPYGLSFMGKKWDYDVPSVEIWKECLRVLKPGGHLLAFAGTRTQHRMAVNIEDAGFEIRDMIAWVYGSGFPKSMNVGKAIDKTAGADRQIVGKKIVRELPSDVPFGQGLISSHADAIANRRTTFNVEVNITIPSTDAAKQWDGWGTALKPALEPITVARKPLSENTVAKNILTWGTGALNIDDARVPTDGESLNGGSTVGSHGAHEGWRRPWMDDPEHNAKAAELAKQKVQRAESLGRWPANLIHDGSEEVLEHFPQTGASRSGQRGAGINGATFKAPEYESTVRGHSDNGGSAARFFYCAKANKRDRDDGLGDMPMRRAGSTDGNSGRSGQRTAGDGVTPIKPVYGRNNHPTVKPTELMRYLCRLVTPPGGTILDPFMGSGSTGKAAVFEGFNFIGIDREEEYVRIAEARIEYAKQQPAD